MPASAFSARHMGDRLPWPQPGEEASLYQSFIPGCSSNQKLYVLPAQREAQGRLPWTRSLGRGVCGAGRAQGPAGDELSSPNHSNSPSLLPTCRESTIPS